MTLPGKPEPDPIRPGCLVRFRAHGDTGLAYTVESRIGKDCDIRDYRGRLLVNVPAELLAPFPPLPIRGPDEFA